MKEIEPKREGGRPWCNQETEGRGLANKTRNTCDGSWSNMVFILLKI